jgi:hypothetical protein
MKKEEARRKAEVPLTHAHTTPPHTHTHAHFLDLGAWVCGRSHGLTAVVCCSCACVLQLCVCLSVVPSMVAAMCAPCVVCGC